MSRPAYFEDWILTWTCSNKGHLKQASLKYELHPRLHSVIRKWAIPPRKKLMTMHLKTQTVIVSAFSWCGRLLKRNSCVSARASLGKGHSSQTEPHCRNVGLSIIRHLQSAAAHSAPLISVTGRNGEAVINYWGPGSGDRSALSLVRFVPNDSSTPRVRRRPSRFGVSGSQVLTDWQIVFSTSNATKSRNYIQISCN